MLKIIRNVKVYRDNEWKKTDILLSDNKIEKIAESIDMKYDWIEEYEFNSEYAVPGYIDQHVHITGGGGEGSFITQVPPMRLTAPVKAGVTTLVGLLGTDGTSRSVANLVAKTKAFNEFGLTAFCLTGNYNYPSPTLTGSVIDDITFVNEIIGVKLAISDHRSPNISDEGLIKLASDVRVAGLLGGKAGIVHLHTGGGKRQLDQIFDILEKTDIPISVFRPTHLGGKYDAALKFANMGGYADITTSGSTKSAGIVYRAIQEFPEGKLTISTDSNGSMPIWNEKKEMIGIGAGKIEALPKAIASLVKDYNCPLEEAVKPATINVAKALNQFPRKGIIQEGSDGDIVILDENYMPKTVIANGKLMMFDNKIMVRENFSDMYE